MTETTSTYVLQGLEADNLLAFLALIGLLRTFDTSYPEWSARVHWSGMPLRASMTLNGRVERLDFIQGAIKGATILATSYAFDVRKDITYSPEEFRKLCVSNAKAKEELRIFSALGSDSCLKRNAGTIESTPYCAIGGQGHQHFLKRLREVVTLDAEILHTALEQALFEDWIYADKTPSFRWDPQEDRRYALQAGDPSEERYKIGTVAGANTLAAVGFSLLTTVPTTSGLKALGVSGRRGDQTLCWPLPGRPTSLAGYRALMQHPELLNFTGADKLGSYGVIGIARAKRILIGQYFNFERAIIQLFKFQ